MRRSLAELAVSVALLLAAAGYFVWWSARPTLASVECRAPDAPYAVRHLSPRMLLDLEHGEGGAHAPGLRADDLSTPTMEQIRLVGAARTGSTPMTVCATHDSRRVLLFTRHLEDRWHCYGTASGCPNTPVDSVTCFETFTLATHARGEPRACFQTELMR